MPDAIQLNASSDDDPTEKARTAARRAELEELARAVLHYSMKPAEKAYRETMAAAAQMEASGRPEDVEAFWQASDQFIELLTKGKTPPGSP